MLTLTDKKWEETHKKYHRFKFHWRFLLQFEQILRTDLFRVNLFILWFIMASYYIQTFYGGYRTQKLYISDLIKNASHIINRFFNEEVSFQVRLKVLATFCRQNVRIIPAWTVAAASTGGTATSVTAQTPGLLDRLAAKVNKIL